MLERLAPRVRRLGSICTGAFALAEAGLLDGHRATTHWANCEAFAAEYPSVQVEADPIFIRDHAIYTSAGVTAGIDLALALVEEDCGHRVALQVARDLVLFLKRPGTQSQFSAPLKAQTATLEPLRDLQAWMVDHLDEDLSVPRLAKQVAMSPRHFARMFLREVGVTPRDTRSASASTRPAGSSSSPLGESTCRRGVRLRHLGNHAAGLPAHGAGGARSVPQPLRSTSRLRREGR